jgi:hypothetical protein
VLEIILLCKHQSPRWLAGQRACPVPPITLDRVRLCPYGYIL